MAAYRAIACLGNPGQKYSCTRHNAGFLFAESLRCYQHGAEGEKYSAKIAELFIENQKLYLIQSQNYMNRSGEPLQQFLHFYKIAHSEIIVVHDEIDLPLGQARWKQGGGDGGHNGLKSVSQELGTSDYLRLRIGVSRPPPEWSAGENGKDAVSSWVLGNFNESEKKVLEEVLLAARESLKILLKPTRTGLEAQRGGLVAAQQQLHAWKPLTALRSIDS